MNVQIVYDLLDNVEKNFPAYEKDVIRILEYIYNDVYDKLDKIDQSATYSDKYKMLKMKLAYYLDGKNSILTYLSEIVSAEYNQQYLEKIVNVTRKYFTIYDNNLYEKGKFYTISFVFNIYMMLKAFRVYSSDYKMFNEFVDDCSRVFKVADFGNGYNLEKRKNLLDKIIEFKNYDIPIVKENFKIIINDLISRRDFDSKVINLYNKSIDEINKVIKDASVIMAEKTEFDLSNRDEIIKRIFDSCRNDENLFYSPILLFGNRFDYINKALNRYIAHEVFSKEFFEIIKSMNYKFFERLDNSSQDSFVYCMEKVFDSDSYREVLNKLKFLAELSCSNKDISEVNCILDSFSTDQYKLEIDGIKIMIINNKINLTNPPSGRIIDRQFRAMRECLVDVIGAEGIPRYEFIDAKQKASNIKEFDELLEQKVKKAKEAKEEKEVDEKRKVDSSEDERIFDCGGSIDRLNDMSTATSLFEQGSDEKGSKRKFLGLFGGSGKSG